MTVPSAVLEAVIAEQWRLVEAHRIARGPRDDSEGGRPRADDLACFEGVLWAVLTGCAGRGWKNLPDQYPSPATCWRRLAEWRAASVWLDRLWQAIRPHTVLDASEDALESGSPARRPLGAR